MVFLKVDVGLLAADGIIHLPTGVVLPLSCTEKVLLCWFIWRYKWWHSQGKVFHDNVGTIARAVGVSEPTVKRFVAKSSDAGVILKGRKGLSNSYIVVDVFEHHEWDLFGAPSQQSHAKSALDDEDPDVPF